jgi:leucyl-tRNA synthetase
MEADQEGHWALSEKIQSVPATRPQLKVLHETIRKVTLDTESLDFNTAIAQMMVFVNEFTGADVRPVEPLATFLHLLNPYAPHLAEELNALLGAKFPSLAQGELSYAAWPEFDEKFLIEDEIEMVVQVNGKLRDRILVKKDTPNEAVEEIAKAAEKVVPHLEGLTLRKVIVVPGKMINIVV